MRQYAVTIGDADRGVIVWDSFRWRWDRQNRIVCARADSLTAMRAEIARLFGINMTDVKLNPQEIAEPESHIDVMTDEEINSVAHHLRVAIERYKTHAAEIGECQVSDDIKKKIADQFMKQIVEARALAMRFEDADSVEIRTQKGEEQ